MFVTALTPQKLNLMPFPAEAADELNIEAPSRDLNTEKS
jgi:hypothetical protein